MSRDTPFPSKMGLLKGCHMAFVMVLVGFWRGMFNGPFYVVVNSVLGNIQVYNHIDRHIHRERGVHVCAHLISFEPS